jgi:acyl-CoA synthetase (AMP-forming)/AMP-acid ligase II
MDSIFSTIPQLIAARADSDGTHPAIEHQGAAISYADLNWRRQRAAAALIAHGIAPGDRVAIWAPNCPEWIIAALAIHSVGAVLVPINTRMKGLEAGYILEKSGARLLFCVGEFLGSYYPQLLAGQRPATLEHLVVLGDGRSGDLGWAAFVAAGGGVDDDIVLRRAAKVEPEDLSDIMFTSGTTGHPKGVMTSHGQNLQGVAGWAAAMRLTPKDRYLIVNPFFHAFGYKAGWLAALSAGATILLEAVFDVRRVLSRIAAERISVLPGPPTLFHSMLAEPDLASFDLSSLRATVTGAATIPPILIERMRRELGFKIVLTGYGLTESCGFATMSEADDAPAITASTCGHVLPGVELKCIGPNGNPLPTGQEGEVLLRGYNVMRGYLDDPGATAAAIDADGWLHTGDVGVLDARGYLRITDRLKDLFIVGGFNCYPAEIERLLANHPGVAQSAVIGVPDERMGEVGCVYVVAKPGAVLAEAGVIAWCREHMANYKVPRHVLLVGALPTNAAGKVVKYQLRELALGQLGLPAATA